MTVYTSRFRSAYLRKRSAGEMAVITANMLAAVIMLALILGVYSLAWWADHCPLP